MNSFFSASIRYPLITLLATAVAGSLLLVMYHLTSHPDDAFLAERSPGLQLDFIRLKEREDELDDNRRRPPEKPVLKRPPKVPPPPRQKVELSDNSPRPRVALPEGAMNIRSGFSASLFGTQNLSPLVRVQPIYPIRAQRRGIEGWVEVEFAIAEDGSVAELRVVDSDPEGIFDKATLKAVSRWRYQPQLVDGKPIRRAGARVVVEFRMEN